MAHGFLSLEDNSGMLYSTSAEYAPDYDVGIQWDSFEYNWPIKNPVVSARDDNQPLFYEIDSPF
jgi:dTDP-4-dehydrorhamnose 3,5-epimerase-like enzyme